MDISASHGSTGREIWSRKGRSFRGGSGGSPGGKGSTKVSKNRNIRTSVALGGSTVDRVRGRAHQCRASGAADRSPVSAARPCWVALAIRRAKRRRVLVGDGPAPRRIAPVDELANLLQAVLLVENRDPRSDRRELVELDVGPRGDDELVADLTRACGGAVQHAAAAAAFSVDHVRGDARARMLVPDFDELERHETDELAIVRIEGDRPFVMQVGAGH